MEAWCLRSDGICGTRLTRSSISPLVYPGLVPPHALAESFIASYDGDDGEEGGDQAERRPDVPPLEDDAEVLRVPGEEHLHGGRACS